MYPILEAILPLIHASISVTDIDVAQAFLCSMFGLRLDLDRVDITAAYGAMLGRPVSRCRLSQLSGAGAVVALELIEVMELSSGPGAEPVLPPAHFAFSSPDLDAAIVRAQALGARRLGAVAEFTEGRSAYLAMPGGGAIELEELVR
jgi:predicted enzyme related to lactoylglutathione lyase